LLNFLTLLFSPFEPGTFARCSGLNYHFQFVDLLQFWLIPSYLFISMVPWRSIGHPKTPTTYNYNALQFRMKKYRQPHRGTYSWMKYPIWRVPLFYVNMSLKAFGYLIFDDLVYTWVLRFTFYEGHIVLSRSCKKQKISSRDYRTTWYVPNIFLQYGFISATTERLSQKTECYHYRFTHPKSLVFFSKPSHPPLK